MSITAVIEVRHDQVGWHSWPAAPVGRAYLSNAHRHVFRIRVRTTVSHNDRDVEFHDLAATVLHVLTASYSRSHDGTGLEFGASSCEHIGTTVLARLAATYGTRAFCVSVHEDDEHGATTWNEAWAAAAIPAH